jgi:uncharacterized protein (DUF2062 family)
MPRRFFRKFAFKRDQISEQWYLAPFRHLLHDHRLWGVRRRNVVPAVALGVFIAFLPFPGHMLAAVLLALALRINIPVAALATWVSNPATVVPINYLGYQVGAKLLQLDISERPFAFAPTIDWFTHTFVTIWQPLVLGCLTLAVAAAFLAYVLLDVLWRISLADYKSRKRSQRKNRKL